MLLTVDIGTSNFKSAIWDYEGNRRQPSCRVAFAAFPLSINLSEGGHHETDSGQWLRAFEDCCRSLGAEVPLTAVEAVVISGNGPSLVPVLGRMGIRDQGLGVRDWGSGTGDCCSDYWYATQKHCNASNYDPRSPIPDPWSLFTASARLWLDRRAMKAAEQVSALMGGYVDASFFLPKVLDIKINEPQLYEPTKFFLGCPEFLAYALTGEARTIFPSDGFERWFWNDSILENLGLDKEKFPPFIRPG
jgi:sugar (pentulose or hexulose) kinase